MVVAVSFNFAVLLRRFCRLLVAFFSFCRIIFPFYHIRLFGRKHRAFGWYFHVIKFRSNEQFQENEFLRKVLIFFHSFVSHINGNLITIMFSFKHIATAFLYTQMYLTSIIKHYENGSFFHRNCSLLETETVFLIVFVIFFQMCRTKVVWPIDFIQS